MNRTTYRATEILKLLAEHPAGMTLSEISVELGLPKTSTFDIIKTLRQTHFLRETNKRFAIGFMAKEVGQAYSQDKDLYGITKDYLKSLSEELRMAGSLVLYEKAGLSYVLEHRPQGSIVAPASSSGTDYIHASASGKVLIAYMTEARRKKAISAIKFKSFTDRTITDIACFNEEIEKVRRVGYAVDDREFNSLMTCVSTPVFSGRSVIAALTLSGLQIDSEVVPGIAERIMATSKLITAKLSQGQ